MNEIIDRWCELAGLLREQSVPGALLEKDLHVFDFDDTLGVTTSSTIVAAVDYNGGDPDDPMSYTPIKDLKSRVGGTITGLQSPTQSLDNFPGLSGDTVKSKDELDDSEAIILDTEQYRDWKEKYIPGGNHVRLVISPSIGSDIKKAGRDMFQRGATGEIHVADFSPSSTIGSNVKPIEQMLGLLAKVNSSGDKTAVVTARKGKTDLDALGGGKIPATNAADIEKFTAKTSGAAPDEVIGAADYNSSDPASAKRDLVIKLHDDQVDNIHFYDDDPENARRVAQICNGVEGLEGTELDIYNYEFAKGEYPSSPTLSCVVGESRKIKVTRKILRQMIAESLGVDNTLQ